MSEQQLNIYSDRYYHDYKLESVRQIWEALKDGDSIKARNLFNEFYSNMLRCQSEDIRAFDARSLMEDLGVVLVSSIRTYGNLGPFRPLDIDEFKGVRLFDILLRAGQIVCASSVSLGDSDKNLYGKWGVIIADGTVKQAFPYDAVSSVSEGEVFSKFQPRLCDARPSEQSAYAIASRCQYNEIDVGIEAIAGIYYYYNPDYISDKDYPSKKFLEMIQPFNIPQYALCSGQFYPITDIWSDQALDLNYPASLGDILDKTVHIDSDQVEIMLAYLSKVLTLAPRNAITSGYTRGSFFYDYTKSSVLREHEVEKFLRHHVQLIEDGSDPSVSLYGAITLHAFAEAARNNDDFTQSDRVLHKLKDYLNLGDYKKHVSRILDGGNIAVTREDLQYYIDNGSLPPYIANH